MMANHRRGEITAELDGRQRQLCLTLGALAELEDAYGAMDLNALIEKFAAGRLSSVDLARIVSAGLRGAGGSESASEVAAMTTDGGALGFARIAAALLEATFGEAEEGAHRPWEPRQA